MDVLIALLATFGLQWCLDRADKRNRAQRPPVDIWAIAFGERMYK